MSKYQFNPQRYTITVGWDSPLNTFFATVCERGVENDFDEPTIWLGTQVGEYPNACQFLRVLRQQMNQIGITDTVWSHSFAQTLEQDQRCEGKGFKERPAEVRQFVLKNQKP
ncbi:hypothetical protein IQ249_15325 [Lusitaniella coriacea LEGE 07157]|uniref:Uncharacterized protein n=1 Tax=Lusitaniella coriacea LEGE 07157 TaxID=945747 RepID=A0A8J7DXS2_9CYAN|nr:hypothetical protein [Lusitaniella coriacea]MBE9117271.1 hypothetical protein [Lusitaniella coriacea LEGE 07157]